ncbi:radical SAM protein (plasmid) [Burkholderia sp. M6-3]
MSTGDDGGWQATALDEKILSLIVMPTEKCNFRCTYCYEDFAHGKMSAQTIESVKLLIRRRVPSLKQLNIGWFGGEPFLARDIVEDITSHGSECAAESGCAFSASATTNGFLLDRSTVQRLCAIGLRNYQISIDGVREQHNLTRRGPNRRSDSFSQIWSNLESIRASNIEISVLIRLHITRENFSFAHSAVDLLNETLLSDPRFSLIIRPVGNLGKDNDSIPTAGNMDFISELESHVSRQSALWDHRIDSRDSICYAGKANSLIIRADGSLSKCTVMLNKPENRVGQLNSDGSVYIDRQKFMRWVSPTLKNEKEGAVCPAAALREKIVVLRRQ